MSQGMRRWLSGTPKNEKPEGPEFLGKILQSPIGLAAGVDKNAELLPLLPDLGFAFAEVGTVTPRPQKGNRKPRLLRLRKTKSLFNRMGFNNDGAEVVATRVHDALEVLPDNFVLGVNVGKNKDTPNEEAHKDYARATHYFKNMVDYVVINVSSPNTPGLRELQNKESLKQIVSAVRGETNQWHKRPKVFLKLGPEVFAQEDFNLNALENELRIEGWVLTNTLASPHDGKDGGLSGGALKAASRLALKEASKFSHVPIISVGGIMSAEEASYRLAHGAKLIQIYTGWIYKGPRFPKAIKKALKPRNS